MRELFEWVERMRSVRAPAKPTEQLPLSLRYHRVAVPSPLDFDRSLIRVMDTGSRVQLFGNLPCSLSVLCWADNAGRRDMRTDQAIATQIGGLMTLALNRRVRVASDEVPIGMEGSDTKSFISSQVNDRELTGPLPENPQDAIEATLKQLLGLPQADRGPLGAAIDLHYASTLLHDVDLNAAYALVVAGIETLSRHFRDPATEWGEWNEAERFDKVFEQLFLSEEQKDRLRTEILKDKHLRLRQGFADYVCERLQDDFWSASVQDYTPALRMRQPGVAEFDKFTEGRAISIEQFVPSNRTVLRRRLLAAYDARSLYVHEGGRRVDSMTSLLAAIPIDQKPTAPVEFAGLRRILLALIRAELEAWSEPVELPGFALLHQMPEDE
jgi:hypothetical protein